MRNYRRPARVDDQEAREAVAEFCVIESKLGGSSPTATLTAQMLLIVRNFLRDGRSVKHLEDMTIDDICECVSRS